MTSKLDSSIPPLKPSYTPRDNPSKPPPPEPAHIAALISALQLRPHVEGGYFAETDRNPLRIPNPFAAEGPQSSSALQEALDRAAGHDSGDGGGDVPSLLRKAGYAADASDATRAASTSILYLLTPGNPQGCFHRNRGRTVHTLVRGRGRYVLLHADEVMRPAQDGAPEKVTGPARAEVFTVGLDVAAGERVQWVVEGGKYKASFLLPDGEDADANGGLLVAETVVPGFEFEDHDFLTDERAAELLRPGHIEEVNWLLRGN